MRTNTTKAKLAEGKVVFGGIITRYAPDLVEILGAIGYDFVMIDCEHGPMNLDQVEHMVRAGEAFGITPIARDSQFGLHGAFHSHGSRGILCDHQRSLIRSGGFDRQSLLVVQRRQPVLDTGVGGPLRGQGCNGLLLLHSGCHRIDALLDSGIMAVLLVCGAVWSGVRRRNVRFLSDQSSIFWYGTSADRLWFPELGFGNRHGHGRAAGQRYLRRFRRL